MEYYYQLLENVTTGTDSSLIFFFVIVAGLVLPLYILIIKDRKYTRQHESEKHDKYIEREKEIISVMRETSAVIAENTVVTAGLKSLLESHGAGIKDGMKRIHERLDSIVVSNAETNATMKALFASISEKRRNSGTQ